MTAVTSVVGSAGTVIGAGSKYWHSRFAGVVTVDQLAGVGDRRDLDAAGRVEGARGDVGGERRGRGGRRGRGRLGGRRRAGRRLRRRRRPSAWASGGGGLLGRPSRVGLGVADAAGDGAELSTASGGRTRKTFGEPLRSWRVTALFRASISAAPCSAARKAVSWAITSSAQAMRVVASWPIRTTLPFVPYVPLNWLQPANPATLPIPNTTSSWVPGRTATTDARGVRVRVDVPSAEQRVLGGGVEHEERLAALPEDRERVAAGGVEAAVAQQGEVRGLEVHRRLRAGHQRAGRVADEQRPAAGAVQGVEAVAAAEAGDPVRVELGVRVLGVGDEREGRVDQVRAKDPLRAGELAAGARAAGARRDDARHDDEHGDQPGLHPRPLARCAGYRDWLATQSANSRRK